MSDPQILAAVLRSSGPLMAIRVSSAQARGAAGKYAYWGAVRYVIRLGMDGAPITAPMERASSDRRSIRLAERDAGQTGRIRIYRIGHIDDHEAASILLKIPALYGYTEMD